MRLAKLFPSLIALFACASTVAAEDPGFAGPWWGTLDAGVVKLRLVFHLRHDGGAWTGDFASPDQGPGTMPVDGVTVDGEKLAINLAKLGADYQGTRSDRDHIKGTFTQRGMKFAVDLARGEPSARVRPQEPKPPYPYAAEDVTVENRAAGLKLGCTLTHPSTGKYPAVIFISGSGQQDRDETIFGHKPFLLLADALARKGVGALRCDDRGKGQSTGNFARSTSLDFAGDVEAELAWLAARPDVDGKHIGLVGHSEGGVIAPIVAARNPKVAFIVMLAGTAARGDEILLQQQITVARSVHLDEAQIAAAQELQKKLIAAVETEKDDQAALAKMKAAIAAAPAAVTKKMSGDVSDAALAVLVSPWYRVWLTLDPRDSLRTLKVPVLAIIGSRDIHVPPAENIPALRSALAGNRDATVKELPGLNHLFQRCTECTVAEYEALTETMAPEALQLVVSWIAQHAR